MKMLNRRMIILILASSTLTEVQCSQIIPQGSPIWINPFEFQVTCRNRTTNEIIPNAVFKCQDRVPVSFILANGENFPKLGLKNQPSCNAFYQSLQVYVMGLKVMRREYYYEAILGESRLTCLKTPPNQIPLGCTLDSIHLQANYGLKRLEIKLLLLKIGEGDNSVIIDATSKFRDRFGPVPLVPFKSEGQSNLEQIVSTRADLNDCIFDAVGSIDTFQIPIIPGIHGFETSQESRIITYSKGATFYEDALASRIIAPQTNEWVIQISNANDTEGYSIDSSSRTGASWQENSMEGDTGVFELHKHFKLIGHEQRATSPYIYFDGKSWYLTQTFEQNCIPLINGEADLSAVHVLRYTLATLYPVQVNGFATTKPKGLYFLDEGSWMLANNFYEPQDMFPAQRMGSHGILTTTVMSQPQTCDLKCTLENLGAAGDYVELMGSAKFQELLTRFTRNTSGLLRTIEALGPQDHNIIVPLLLMVRNFENLQDDDLMHRGSAGGWSKIPPSGWGYSGSSVPQSAYKNLHQMLKNESRYYIYAESSLKLLPLISVSRAWGSTEKKVWIYPSRRNNNQDNQQVDTNPFKRGRDFYQAFADFLSVDEMIGFQSCCHTHESDTELTIQPFARVIRHLKNLKEFHICFHTGMENLQYLIKHGLSQNQSITEIHYQFKGGYPAMLFGELLAKNTTLRILSLSFCRMVNGIDLEGLNELGKGLKRNKTLEQLYINLCIENGDMAQKRFNLYADWEGIYSPSSPHYNDPLIRPLPGRPRGSQPTNFDELRDALMTSKITYITIYKGYGNPNPSVDLLMDMIRGINKPGLVKNI